MKKLVLLFTAVMLAGTVAFAAEHESWEDPGMCYWRQTEGLPFPEFCESLLENGQPLTKKCCFKNPLCINSNAYWPHFPTCESMLTNGQSTVEQWCCWNSRENIANLLNAKGNNDKGGKKTSAQAPKDKKGNKLQPVKTNSAKVQTNTKKVTAKK